MDEETYDSGFREGALMVAEHVLRNLEDGRHGLDAAIEFCQQIIDGTED